MSRKQIIKISFCLGTVFFIVAIIINSLFKIKTEGFFMAEWSSGDALNYVAAIAGAISTFVLGLVAYKQNEKLQHVEEYNYIANNSSMVLIHTVQIKPKPNMPVNFDLHTEQMLDESKNNDIYKTGYKCSIHLKKIGAAIPSLIYIEKATFLLGNQEENALVSDIWCNNIRRGYSRLCIMGNDEISFEMTFFVQKEKQKKFEDAIIKNHNLMIIEFEFTIITDRYVGTSCKCRAHCNSCNENNIIKWVSDNPQVFFYGHKIIDKDEIVILEEKQ